MKLLKYIVLLAMVTVLSACTTTSVQNVPTQHAPAGGNSSSTMKNAILAGGKSRGWDMKSIKPGLIEASYVRGKHVAIVDVPYTAKTYKINRKSSSGFEYDAKKQTIRRHYNWWVDKLNDSIQGELVEKAPLPKPTKAATKTKTSTKTS